MTTRDFFIFALLLITMPLTANPWGKDAELATDLFLPPPPEPCCKSSQSPLAAIGESMINFHQTVITQIDGPRSNYLPSSSQYTRDAICKYGFFKGVMYGCDRLMRENDETWVYPNILGPMGLMKYDPVK